MVTLSPEMSPIVSSKNGKPMQLSERQIKTLIAKGEGISLEFKTCRDQLSRDVYETVCAFQNRHGGTLLLGVNDAGQISARLTVPTNLVPACVR
jgi:hypothetical protein